MFVSVVSTAVAMRPPLGPIVSGLFLPTIPPGGALWTIALMGGIGGTVTVVCYGYWIREEGREGVEQLPLCRLDLAVCYAMTAIFGLSMVVIGNSLGPMEGGGATLMVKIADQFQTTFGAAGPIAKWVFLAGAWGAVFTSMLGVWQSVPYLFADLWQLLQGAEGRSLKVDTASRPYQAYLYAIATVPIVSLFAFHFQSMQKVYAVVGALFIPMLAAVLLVLNGRADWVGQRNKNSLWTTAALIGALVLFAVAGVVEVRDTLFPSR
jgi:Mn2+/Fe2+ NRAMP family transporter